MSFLTLPKPDKEMYDRLGFREKLDAVDEGIRRSAQRISESSTLLMKDIQECRVH
jgi:carnosine N-methyltransferase